MILCDQEVVIIEFAISRVYCITLMHKDGSVTVENNNNNPPKKQQDNNNPPRNMSHFSFFSFSKDSLIVSLRFTLALNVFTEYCSRKTILNLQLY